MLILIACREVIVLSYVSHQTELVAGEERCPFPRATPRHSSAALGDFAIDFKVLCESVFVLLLLH